MENQAKIKVLIIAVCSVVLLISIFVLLILTNKGTLDISTTPSEATILLDGTEKGKTPLVLKGVKAGSHSLEIKKDGYATTKKDLKVKRSTLKINETLERALPEITKKLPQNTTEYVIEYTTPDPKNYTDLTYKILLKARLNKVTPERWARYQEELKKYKADALKWLKDNGVDTEKVKIEYNPPEAKDIKVD